MLVYDDGQIKLFNCDCRNLHVSSDVIFADPPFDLDLKPYYEILLSARHHSFVMSSERNLIKMAYINDKYFSRLYAVDTIQANLISNKAPMTQADFIAEFRFTKTKFKNLNDGFSTLIRVVKRRNIAQMSNNFDKKSLLPGLFIMHFSENKEIIYDPFAGSCSTLIAAKYLGRKAVGCEIDEKICEKFVMKMKQLEFF